VFGAAVIGLIALLQSQMPGCIPTPPPPPAAAATAGSASPSPTLTPTPAAK
jgi:hypothetical protein